MEENKFVWVLIESIALFGEPGKKNISVLSTFEKAKAKMQRLIKKQVSSEDGLFEDGQIFGFDEFVEEYEYKDEDPDLELSPEIEALIRATRGEPSLKPIEAMLNDYFNSEGDYEVDEKLSGFFATNHMIECNLKKDADGEYSLTLEDIETELKRYIGINTFSMNNPEKYYHFIIENEFFEFSYLPGSLKITLLRVDLDDWMNDI